MKAIITSASHVRQDGTQEVAFDVVKDGVVLLSHTIAADVDAVKGAIENFLVGYKLKALSENKVAAGEEIEV